MLKPYKPRRFIVTGIELELPVNLAFKSYKPAEKVAKKLLKGEVFDIVLKKTVFTNQ